MEADSDNPQYPLAWQLLRQALAGHPLPNNAPFDAIADAARRGEVAALAHRCHPELGRRLARTVGRLTVLDMNLELALQRLAACVSTVARPSSRALPVALLKGTATGYLLYEQPSDRMRRDIDVLVAGDALPALVRALEQDGWVVGPLQPGKASDIRRARAWPMVLELPAGPMVCDVHRRLSRSARYRLNESAILKRAINLEGAPLPVTALGDTLIHTAVHLAASGYLEPLKGWVDIYRLASHAKLDWLGLVARAKAVGAAATTWAALTVIERWFGARLPTRLVKALRPPRWQALALRTWLSGQGELAIVNDRINKRIAIGITAMITADNLPARGIYAFEWFRRRIDTLSSSIL